MFSINSIKLNKTALTLVLICFISLLLNIIKPQVPACLNADEASFGYNAYSILKTGKDEYGNTLPVRLKSFGDYKMPIFSYGAIPFIALFGLNEYSIRMLNTFIVAILPFLVFLLSKELFRKDAVSLIAAFITASSLGIHIISRQAHEAVIASALITLTSIFFLKCLGKNSIRSGILFIIFLFLSLFSYQSARIFGALFAVLSILFFIRKRLSKTVVIGCFIVLSIFIFTDLKYKPTRIEHLLFFKTPGFAQKIYELRTEGGKRFFYNKLTIGSKDLSLEYLKYFSPDFLSINGDGNPRFGFPGMSPITPVEYILFLAGLFFIYKNKKRWRWFLILLLLISPISGSLSWSSHSLTRTYFLLIPLFVISAYGLFELIKTLSKNRFSLLLIIVVAQSFFLYYSWDFYLNHYPKRAHVFREWQCGYEELVKYVKTSYEKYSRFYITIKYGQPYIFFLYHLKYPPEKYQKQAFLSSPDKYGFGQVEHFDKFYFGFPSDKKTRNTVYIGFPDDFEWLPKNNLDKIKKIKISTEEIFWIYEGEPKQTNTL